MEKMYEHYFKIQLYGDNWSDIPQESKYVFFDPYLKVTEFDYELLYIILHFITDYSLSDLELILRLSGFSTLLPEEMPDHHFDVWSYSSSKNNMSDCLLHDCSTKEQAEKYIEEKLGVGIISKYRQSKKNQLAHKKYMVIKEAEKLGLGVYNLSKGRCK